MKTLRNIICVVLSIMMVACMMGVTANAADVEDPYVKAAVDAGIFLEAKDPSTELDYEFFVPALTRCFFPANRWKEFSFQEAKTVSGWDFLLYGGENQYEKVTRKDCAVLLSLLWTDMGKIYDFPIESYTLVCNDAKEMGSIGLGSVSALIQIGAFQLSSDGYFCPQEIATVGELAHAVCVCMGISVETNGYVTPLPIHAGNTETKPKETIWSKVDDWAIEELKEAEKNSLIPETFKGKDFTSAITRNDFAAVAVKLYEGLTGKKAEKGANPFTDTNDEYVLKAYALGITNGTSNTKFSPNNDITREQMATMLTRAIEKAGIKSSIDLNKVNKFADDFDMHDWGRNSIYFMAQNGLIKGVGDNKFSVLGKAKIEEAIVIAYRAVQAFAK